MIAMAAPSLDNEFMQYWSKLTVVEKESLMNVAKNYVQLKDERGRISLEQYNKEIEEAEAEFENGDYITHEEMMRQMKQW